MHFQKRMLLVIIVNLVNLSLTSQSNTALYVDSTQGIGLQIDYSLFDGVRIKKTGGTAINIDSTESGVFIKNSENYGFFVVDAGTNGFDVVRAEDHGFLVRSTGEGSGLYVTSAQDNGVYVDNTVQGSGVEINNAGRNGIHVLNAGRSGIQVDTSTTNGVQVSNAGGDGIYVFDAHNYSLNILGEKDAMPTVLSSHIAKIHNRSIQQGASVLALQLSRLFPEDNANYITFFKGDNAAAGAIEGNGLGGVVYKSGGADFAEYMPVYSDQEVFSPGDIVGILDGKVTFNTSETNKVMVITDRPIVVGNMQGQEEDGKGNEIVGFIGQVSVRIRGKVTAGDWIVSSELNDGTGYAVSTDAITLDHKIVGQAWESSEDPGIKRVNTAIGLDQSAAKNNLIKQQQSQINDLQDQINELKKAFANFIN